MPWRVVARSRLVTRPLNTTGLDEQLPMCTDVDEALRAVAPTYDAKPDSSSSTVSVNDVVPDSTEPRQA